MSLETVSSLIQNFTFQKMQSLWLRNMAVNMPEILAGKDIKDLPRLDGKPCIVIGAGPSVSRFRQIEVLAESGWRNPIICQTVCSFHF
jgi:hypothetical protein